MKIRLFLGDFCRITDDNKPCIRSTILHCCCCPRKESILASVDRIYKNKTFRTGTYFTMSSISIIDSNLPRSPKPCATNVNATDPTSNFQNPPSSTVAGFPPLPTPLVDHPKLDEDCAVGDKLPLKAENPSGDRPRPHYFFVSSFHR